MNGAEIDAGCSPVCVIWGEESLLALLEASSSPEVGVRCFSEDKKELFP